MLFLVFAISTPAMAADLLGRVVGVSDGDTITVLDSNHFDHRIRLAGIDAPEKGQPFGERAKQGLSRAVYGKDVRVEWDKRDKYGRLVAKVWVAPPGGHCDEIRCPKSLDVGHEQLLVGLAWHYGTYEGEQSTADRRSYAAAEKDARARRAGLWSEADPVAPWDWRHGLKDGPIKKSRNDICHEPGSPSYRSVRKFTSFKTIEDCIASGGRLPKQAG
jgi:endonuclease YncB( thermonuclease family)